MSAATKYILRELKKLSARFSRSADRETASLGRSMTTIVRRLAEDQERLEKRVDALEPKPRFGCPPSDPYMGC